MNKVPKAILDKNKISQKCINKQVHKKKIKKRQTNSPERASLSMCFIGDWIFLCFLYKVFCSFSFPLEYIQICDNFYEFRLPSFRFFEFPLAKLIESVVYLE